jgi:hypothetical protein
MRKKNITISELFRKMNILITDELKEKMEYEKEKTTLLADMEIDNSSLVRAMVWYFYDNDQQLKKLVPYLKKTKGHNMLEEFHNMVEKNADVKEIENKLGISVEIIEKIEQKQKELDKE